jgi:hypothetical protein
MADYRVVEPAQFLRASMFRQDEFLDGIGAHDWEQYRNHKVLVRGCGDIVTPPWAYMAIAARLVGIAGSVRYGNEHDHVVIYRQERRA